MRFLLLTVTAFLSSTAFAQIEVPPSSEPYRVLTARITAPIPPGAQFDGGWSASESVSFVEHDAKTIHLTAAPGTHRLTYAGFWVHTKTVTFKDGDGKTVSIESYLGSGQVNESAEFTVVGGADPVPPLPPGPEVGRKKIVFFIRAEQIEKLPLAQRYIVTSLEARKKLKEMGHRTLVLDDNSLNLLSPPTGWAPFIESVKGDPLPRVAISPLGGGAVADYPLPPDFKRLLELPGVSQ